MRYTSYKFVLLLADLVGIVAASRLAYLLRYELDWIGDERFAKPFEFYWVAIALAVGVWIVLYLTLRLDQLQLEQEISPASSHLATAIVVLTASLLAGAYLAKTYYSRLLLVFLFAFMVVFLVGTRVAYRSWLAWLKKHGKGLRRVVIVGQSDLSRELADRIAAHQELHYELVGFVYPSRGRADGGGNGSTLHSSGDLVERLVAQRVDELIFTVPIRRDTEVLDVIASCQKQGIQIRLIPEYYELHQSQIRSFTIDGIPIFELRETFLEPPYRVLKLLMDYTIAPVLLVVAAPLMLVIAVMLALVPGGKIIMREERAGRDGERFVMYRFDVSPCESMSPDRKPGMAARFCRFLYRYSFSELPQLWNVLRGEMSIVGPRPETPERVRHYSAWHRRRLLFKPGITGLAQVNGLRGLDSSDVKTKYDLEYSANYTPFLDIALMLATVSTLFRRRKAARIEREPTSVTPPQGTLRAKSV